MNNKINVVVSGVNLVEGGILSVLEDCLSASERLIEDYDLQLTVLVHKKELVKIDHTNIRILEFPAIKSSWSKRIYFEYVECKKISKNLGADLWISLHDMTPNVDTKLQVVYCHNPSPFYESRLGDFFIDYKLFLFSYFYKYLYGINIKKNRFVIIQQNWLRKAFEKAYGIKTIVAYPSIDLSLNIDKGFVPKEITKSKLFTFFYPSFPRIFKNFEVLFDAVIEISKTRKDFELLVTIDALQNKLGMKLYNKYKNCNQIKFIGKQSRSQVYEIFESCNALVFPSKLETWGLPLTEAKQFNKPIIVSDLEYAHENIQDYEYVKFFNPNSVNELVLCMTQILDGKMVFDRNPVIRPDQPFFLDWESLLKFLIDETKKK